MRWTEVDEKQLQDLIANNKSIDEIATAHMRIKDVPPRWPLKRARLIAGRPHHGMADVEVVDTFDEVF